MGVLATNSLLFGVQIRAPGFLKLSHKTVAVACFAACESPLYLEAHET